MAFSLVLMHMIAFGIFGLKQLPLASTLTIPLPIMTLLFNNYCQKRFQPVFRGYPAECMITKDRREENDPALSEFHRKLVTAYQDPALKPIQFSERTDSVPLLASESEIWKSMTHLLLFFGLQALSCFNTLFLTKRHEIEMKRGR